MRRAKGARRGGWPGERGSVLVIVAFSLVVLLGMAGLAVDSSRGFLARARLARAVDAAALAGARSLRAGRPAARREAEAAAAANGVRDGRDGVRLGVEFGTNGAGEPTVQVEARRSLRTLLMGLLGHPSLGVAAAAEAAVPPIDLVLVVDQSGSLREMGAWDDLQDAARRFVRHFDDDIDQLGMVSFQIRATHRFPLGHGFTGPIVREIAGMQSDGDTNTGEGLRLAAAQMQGPAVRERAAQVVVFFTDGRPTAFRGRIGGPDRMLAVFRVQHGGELRGYFDDPDGLPTDGVAWPDGCAFARECFGWDEPTARERARAYGLQWAGRLREENVHLYTIGLGNPDAEDPLETPDLDYLRRLANEDGVESGSQPAGRSYFAPTASELRSVFDRVAVDLLVRLSR